MQKSKQYYNEHEIIEFLKDSPVRNEDANSNADILQYYITSVKGMNAELEHTDIKTNGQYVLTGISFNQQYVCANISNGQERFVSYYIRKNYRGQGVFKSLIKESKVNNETIITTVSCKIYDILVKYEANIKLAQSFFNYSMLAEHSSAEEFIYSVYNNKRTGRSKIPMLNHILEGCYVLNTLNINENDEASAYSLHPVFQDTSLSLTNLAEYMSNRKYSTLDTNDIIQAAAYARVANGLLLTQFKEGGTVPNELYRNPTVKNMLIADKIQNYKDFEIYHAGTHKDSDKLDEYFEYWLESLSIHKATYHKVKAELIHSIQVELNLEDLV